MKHFQIETARLLESLETMAQIGKVPGEKSVTRLALSEEDRRARDLLVHWFWEEGLEVKIDPIGNIFGIRPGIKTDALPIISGSHLDTVRQSGIFDGALGVLSALEAVRRLNEENIKTKHPIVVACFTNEEGARFQPDMMGSLVFTGIIPLKEALSRTDDNGVSVSDALDDINYRGNDTIIPGKYLELHVEQGPVLFEQENDIGVVEGIQGIAWWRGRFMGEANHAGTTPLQYRKDALYGCAELCCELRRVAETHGDKTVTTMGRLQVQPDVINVIPRSAQFTIDFRQYNEKAYKEGKILVETLVQSIAEHHDLVYNLESVADTTPVRFNPSMVNLVESKAKEMGFTYTRMYSGAGHDAGSLTHVCPTSMIFIPSVDGRSHSPEEKTRPKDITNGANLLLYCILELAKD